MKKEKLILSIETGIRGGSISILKDKTEIDFWIGENEVSKSEDVLPQIARLFEKNKIKKDEIDLLTVSNGPGSHTGLKIGIAIALGLKKSCNSHLRGVSVLEALTLNALQRRVVLTAVPFGKNFISWQEFEIGDKEIQKKSAENLSLEDSFLEELTHKDDLNLIICHYLFNKFKEFFESQRTQSRIKIKAEINLAKQIGLYGQTDENTSDNAIESINPIYLLDRCNL